MPLTDSCTAMGKWTPGPVCRYELGEPPIMLAQPLFLAEVAV
jgi:hypothetical protein